MIVMGGVNKVDFGGTTLIDLTGDNVSEDTLLFGVRAHNAAGEEIVGTVKAHFTSATLLASGWTAGSDGRYQQTVAAEGVAEDTAVVIVQGPMRGIDPEVTQGDGSLTFYCDVLPIANIEIKIGIPV